MATIRSFHDEAPSSNSNLPFKTVSKVVRPSHFRVEALRNNDEVNRINIMFPSRDSEYQGIRLGLEAPEAISLAYAILGVALGNVDEINGVFPD